MLWCTFAERIAYFQVAHDAIFVGEDEVKCVGVLVEPVSRGFSRSGTCWKRNAPPVLSINCVSGTCSSVHWVNDIIRPSQTRAVEVSHHEDV